MHAELLQRPELLLWQFSTPPPFLVSRFLRALKQNPIWLQAAPGGNLDLPTEQFSYSRLRIAFQCHFSVIIHVVACKKNFGLGAEVFMHKRVISSKYYSRLASA